MQHLQRAQGKDLEWVHPSLLRREYELRSEADVFAMLRWESAFGSLAIGETADGSWTFKRGGFLRPSVTARVAGSDAEVATLHPGWRGEGPLVLGNGETFEWRNTGFWQAAWGFARPGGEPLVQFHPKFTLIRRVTSVQLDPAAYAMPDLPLLATLGWYLMVLMANESSAATAAIIM